jgi:hypothetical protein
MIAFLQEKIGFCFYQVQLSEALLQSRDFLRRKSVDSWHRCRVTHFVAQYFTIFSDISLYFAILLNILQYFTIFLDISQYFTILHDVTWNVTMFFDMSQYFANFHDVLRYVTIFCKFSQYLTIFCNYFTMFHDFAIFYNTKRFLAALFCSQKSTAVLKPISPAWNWRPLGNSSSRLAPACATVGSRWCQCMHSALSTPCTEILDKGDHSSIEFIHLEVQYIV